MNRYVKCACAAFGLFFSLVGHAATSQSFSAYGWYGDDPDWDFAATDYVSQMVTPLTSGSHEFTVTVPRGYQVAKWQVAGGDDVLSARNAMRNSPAVTLATDATSYTYTYGDVTGTRVAIGVRLDPIPYKIAFNAKGGSGTMATMQVADYFANTNLAKSAFTRTGYGFNGWATNETTMARVFADRQSVTGASFDAVVKANDTANLYACWTANVYTVTFNANGGSVSPTSRKIAYDATYGELPTPTWTGHSFSGWYTDPTGGSKIDKTTTLSRTENHTLYAHWSAIKHTISTMTSGDGSGTVSGGGQYDYGATATLEAKPSRGSRFMRWSDGETENPHYVTVTGDKLYSARFELVTVKVSFDSVGGSSVGSTNITYGSKYGPLPTPTKAGHTFQGWFTAQSGGLSVSADTLMQEEADHTLYAHWSVNSYVITVAKTGTGSGSLGGGGSYQYGAKATLTATAYSDSEFVKWSDGSTANPREVTVTGANTYTAEFKLKHYTVTFAFKTATGADTNVVIGVDHGKSVTPPNANIWVGHAFDYWTPGAYTSVSSTHTEEARYTINHYTIQTAVDPSGNGTGSVSGGGSKAYGETVQLTANPYTGSRFVKWSDGNTANPRSVTVTGAATYTAKFELVTVQVAFDSQGGSSVGSTNITYGSAYGQLPTPTMTGYKFDGWYTSSTGGSRVYDDTKMQRTENHTLYAHWSVVRHTISTMTSGDGSGTVSGGGQYDYGATATLKATPYTGSKFVRWSDGITENPHDVTVTGDKLYSARFELVTVQVSFDSQGGSSVGSTNITYGSAYGQLPTPTKTGCTFDGWYTASTGGSRVSDDTKMQRTENHTLYAHWNAAKYTITIQTSGEGKGTFSGNGTYEYEKSATLAVYPSTGSRFVKWSDGDTANPRTVTVTKDATYTAVLALEQLEVTFCFRTATGGWTNEVRTVGYGQGVEPPDADIWIGHHFYLWTPENYRQVYSSHTETANYEEYSYIIHFDGNGGSCTLNDIPTKYTQQVTLNKVTADKVSRIGYVFAGWSLDKNAQQAEIADGAMVSQLSAESGGTATLYAVWTPIPYRIAFAPGAGTGTMEPMTNVLYGVVTNLTPNAFKKTGCAFLRWKREGTDETYLDGAAVSNLTTIADATVTLTAVWDAPYWVKFEPNGGTGTMAVQRFDAGETKQLTANAFTCTGYTFDGWSTNGVTGVVFKDRAELTDAFPVGTTNVLKAVWAANTYTVKFLKGGSDVKGTMMPDQTFTYGEAQMLTQCTYTRENWKFIGWSNTISRVVYADKASVSNLTTKARGVIPLLALWESTLSVLSKALDCDNLNWESIGDADYAWTVFADASAKSGKCVRQQSLWSSANNTLCADIHTNGTLRFFWKPTSATTKMTIGVYVGTTTIYSEQRDADAGLLNQWNEVNVTVPALGKDVSTATIKIFQEDEWHYEDDETPVYLYLDDMTWKPEGGMVYPEPTDENRVETSALSLTSEGWSLSFTGEENFDYQLLSTETLTPPDWQPFGDRIHGDGNPQSFVVPQDPAEPQRFFKIQTLQRQGE